MRRRAGKLVERRGALHETDPGAVLALLEAEGARVPTRLWEPCCGRGAIVAVLQDQGYLVCATDIAGELEGQDGVLDFLSSLKPPRPSVRGIVTNPPFEEAAVFVRHAIAEPLSLDWAAFLLPFAFWEAGTGSGYLAACRRFVLDERPPARCWVFANRLPRMHREGWEGNRTTSMEPFAWFVWDSRHPLLGGATAIRRVLWRPLATARESGIAGRLGRAARG